MAKVMNPTAKDAVSVRKVYLTEEDRRELNRAFREQKELEQKFKEERFARIYEERRKRRDPSKSGININVKTD